MPTVRVALARSISRRSSIGVLLAVSIAFGAPPGARAQVSSVNSFYVPQSGPVATPTEGTLATRFFRACPNNDGGGSLPNSARIKVVLRDALNVPLSGIAAADICMLFNGGTLLQGFVGVGADSIIANSTYNPDPLCPNLTCVQADAPTDVTGTTYITFTGASSGAPGVGVRDPNRKWGHYDSHIPVYAMGVPIAGKLTTASAINTYVLRIKNMDVEDGLELDLNAGEAVTMADLGAVIWSVGVSSPESYWLDLDSNGSVGATDVNLMLAHFNHDCDTPNNP